MTKFGNNARDEIQETEFLLSVYFRKMSTDIEKDMIKIGEDEDHVYYFNERHQARLTKGKHWMRLNGEKW